jgi:hypothetical protein
VLLRKGYGVADREAGVPNTPDTRFPIGSMTRDFTWLTLIQLEEEGAIDYDMPLHEFAPDWPGAERITINHLANYRAGLENLESLPSYSEREQRHWQFDQVLDLIRSRPLLGEPGGTERRGSSSYILLAHVIELVTGKSYGTRLASAIFEPAGMTRSGDAGPTGRVPDGAKGTMPDLDGEGVMDAPSIDLSIRYGSGSLYSTADDLYRFRRAVMNHRLCHEIAGNHIFRPEQRNGLLVAEHAGSIPGYATVVREYLRKQLCIIVLSNNHAQVQHQIVNDLSSMMLGETVEPIAERLARVAREARTRADTSGVVTAPLENGVGTYRFDFDETGSVEERAGRYVLSFPRGRITPLLPEGDGVFFLPLWWAYVQFEAGDDGRAMAIAWTDITTGNVARGFRVDLRPDARW